MALPSLIVLVQMKPEDVFRSIKFDNPARPVINVCSIGF